MTAFAFDSVIKASLAHKIRNKIYAEELCLLLFLLCCSLTNHYNNFFFLVTEVVFFSLQTILPTLLDDTGALPVV